jgi:hypothetical protein
MVDTVASRETKAVILFTRVDPSLKDRVKRVADRDFDGNESRLVRDSVRLMINLREELGPRFEIVIAGLISDRPDPS